MAKHTNSGEFLPVWKGSEMVPVLHRSQQQSVLACFVWKYLYFLKFFQAYTWKQVKSLTSDSLYPWEDLPVFAHL